MKLYLSMICYVLLNSCAMNHNKEGLDKEGHRGCRGLMPENTIPAMLHAIDLGVNTIEMDVHITKDLQIILSHDPWFNPETTTKPDGTYITPDEPKHILYAMDYDSIQKYDVGLKPYAKFPRQQKIHVVKPLLSALIDSVEDYCIQKKKRVSYNIEIKVAPEGDSTYHPLPDKYTDLLMSVIRAKQIGQYVIIQSFDPRSLRYLHQHYPQVRTSLLINEGDKRSFEDAISELGFTPTIYSPHFSLVTTGLLTDCHKNDVKVIPWTVNDVVEMRKLRDLGVDGMISDYPDLYAGL